jgi:anthranilate synthase component 1
MQAPFDLPTDLDTPLSAYLKLGPLRPRFLLESVAGPERAARYSFLGFGPADEFSLAGDELLRNGEPFAPARTATELAEALRRALASAPEFQPTERSLPFHGGLVGVLGYELVRRLERLARAKPTPFPELRLLAPHAVLVFDHARRTAALLANGSGEERARLRAEVRKCLAGPLPARPSGGRVSPPRATLPREAFLERAQRVLGHLRDGDVYQLVLASAFEGETDLAPLELYRALRLTNPSPYMTLFEFEDFAVVGASPEALVRVEEGRATLQPIAGTRPRGRDHAHDLALERELAADPKEAAEHVMLVDLARNDLGRVARPGSVEVGPFRSVERFSHVMHLVSGVTGEIDAGRDALDCLLACFPAGTVVGAPKVRAMQLIDELEPEARGLYAGSIGYLGHGGAVQQALLIRSLFLAGGRYRYQAGAGIVAQSVPEKEHDEILAKSAALARALELAAEGL